MVGLAVLCAFEDGVFHKVGETVFVCQFVAGARFHHEHQVGNLALFFLMYQPDAVGKDGFGVFVFQHFSINCVQKYVFLQRNTKTVVCSLDKKELLCAKSLYLFSC